MTGFVLDLTAEFDRLRAELREELLAELRDHPAAEQWPGWLSVKSAAKYLDVSPERIYKLVQRNEIPFVQHGAGCRLAFERAALDQWMSSQTGGA